MSVKAIPAFYGVYLLRSTVRKSSSYIGSTPHPSRRLGQHNGRSGGAVRTSRASLRPWEMACIVAGFPSNIAALQFEWAWHNAHLTRHVAPEQRISFATTRTKVNSRTGKTRKKPGRPRSSLLDKLSNLHLLLRVPYFANWPLEVRFFSEEVYKSWQSWGERVDEEIRPGIRVFLDVPKEDQEDDEFTSAQPPAKRRKIDLIGKGGVEGVDPTYARYQDVLTKSTFILDEGDEQKCGVCACGIHVHRDLFTICPHNRCQSLSHVACIAKSFSESSTTGTIVPERGHCPSCQSSLLWVDLMREVTLRTRGQKEIKKLLSKKRSTKAATAAEILETENEDDADEDGDVQAADVVDEEADENEMDDLDDSDDDARSVVSTESRLSTMGKSVLGEKKVNRLEIVIEDSDDEG